MIPKLQADAKDRMLKTIEALKNELSKLRTGRAHPRLLDHVMVDYYGSSTPLSQVANVTVEDARTLAVSAWDKSMVAAVEKAIMNSDLGLNPSRNGDLLRVPMPALTEERRKELIKVVRAEGENARVAVRNTRRDANQSLKDALKDKLISEDDQRRCEEAIQKLTDQFIKDIDQLLSQKETDLMEV